MLAAILTLTTCAGSTAKTDFCLIAKPINGSKLHDTKETMRQIDEHNAVGVRLCGW